MKKNFNEVNTIYRLMEKREGVIEEILEEYNILDVEHLESRLLYFVFFIDNRKIRTELINTLAQVRKLPIISESIHILVSDMTREEYLSKNSDKDPKQMNLRYSIAIAIIRNSFLGKKQKKLGNKLLSQEAKTRNHFQSKILSRKEKVILKWHYGVELTKNERSLLKSFGLKTMRSLKSETKAIFSTVNRLLFEEQRNAISNYIKAYIDVRCSKNYINIICDIDKGRPIDIILYKYSIARPDCFEKTFINYILSIDQNSYKNKFIDILAKANNLSIIKECYFIMNSSVSRKQYVDNRSKSVYMSRESLYELYDLCMEIIETSSYMKNTISLLMQCQRNYNHLNQGDLFVHKKGLQVCPSLIQ